MVAVVKLFQKKEMSLHQEATDGPGVTEEWSLVKRHNSKRACTSEFGCPVPPNPFCETQKRVPQELQCNGQQGQASKQLFPSARYKYNFVHYRENLSVSNRVSIFSLEASLSSLENCLESRPAKST